MAKIMTYRISHICEEADQNDLHIKTMQVRIGPLIAALRLQGVAPYNS